jgi:hypothetical protein
MSGCIGIQTLQTSFFSVKKRFIGLKGKAMLSQELLSTGIRELGRKETVEEHA